MVYSTKEVYHNPLYNVKNFLLKRFFRIAPLYYILTLLYVYLTYSGFINFDKIIKAFLFYPDEDYHLPNAQFPPLEVGWTLNYEMFFYFLFGLSLFFKAKRYLYLCATVLMLVFIPPIFIDIKNELRGVFLYPLMVLITNVLLLQFLLGVAIGLLLPKLNFQRTVVLFILTLSIITFFLYYFNYFEFYLSDLVVCGLLVFSVILLDTSNIHMKVSSMLI